MEAAAAVFVCVCVCRGLLSCDFRQKPAGVAVGVALARLGMFDSSDFKSLCGCVQVPSPT